MIILPHKENFIRKNFIEFSFDDSDVEDFHPDFKLFKKLNSTDLYYLAQNYNWDDGIKVLNWIIDSPKCDKGCASLIFWTAEPDFYFEYTEDTIPDYERETFDLLKKITNKFRNNEFKKNSLKYDPSYRVNKIEWTKEYKSWQIPEELKYKTKGYIPISLSTIQSLIWEWQRKRKLAKREAKKRNRRK